MIENPCKDCKTRYRACHDSCEEFIRFSEYRKAEKEALKSDNFLYISEDVLRKQRRRQKRNLSK